MRASTTICDQAYLAPIRKTARGSMRTRREVAGTVGGAWR
jgi:hypothetical protein